jgi:hypothetical protein
MGSPTSTKQLPGQATMSVGSEPESVRTEDNVGPSGDKHALIADNYREVHLGPHALDCTECVEAINLAT